MSGNAPTVATALPPGACDCHCHIFGPAENYPALALEGYSLPAASREQYLAMADRLGFARRVFIQPVIYGGDNSLILDSLGALGPEATRASAESRRARLPRRRLPMPWGSAGFA